MFNKQSFNDLVRIGECLCKSGDCSNGIKYFQAAIDWFAKQNEENKLQENENSQVLKTVTIIYNQMGNAYFNLQDYPNALKYHKKDLELSEQFGDESDKAKAYGNIGNTLHLMGDYDEAIVHLNKSFEISKNLNNTIDESRALYNLANVYQSKGKFMAKLTHTDNSQDSNTDEFSSEIREVLMKAVHYYNEMLKLVANKERQAEGRTYGNLGNTYYLLGDFELAIQCHNERLKIAKEFDDKAAERRAYSNLGNAHIFQGRFTEAADFYLKALNVAITLADKAIEAQSYYSLGNVYTLLQDYSASIDFHLRHLQIAQSLEDKIGESKAYCSLSNAYASLGDLENAIMFANRHLNLMCIIGDTTSELMANKNFYDYQNLFKNSVIKDNESDFFTSISKNGRKYFDKTNSMCKSNDTVYINTKSAPLIMNNSHFQTSCDNKNLNISLSNSELNNNESTLMIEDDPSFLDILSRMQSNRLDDQRCSIKQFNYEPKKNIRPSTTKLTKTTVLDEDLFDLIVKSQQSRLEDQRSSFTQTSKIKSVETLGSSLISDSSSSYRSNSLILNNQIEFSISSSSSTNSNEVVFKDQTNKAREACTIPADDSFFSIIQKIQSRRLDEQRTLLK